MDKDKLFRVRIAKMIEVIRLRDLDSLERKNHRAIFCSSSSQ